MKQARKAISMLLAVVMLFTNCPISAFATTTTETSSGDRNSEIHEYEDFHYITLSACSEHIFGDWITEQEATAVSMGIRYHECQNCFAKVVEYLPAEAGDFTCTVLNGTYCQITGYTGTETEISIPSEIDGYIVLHIAERAFQDNTALTTVVFPETIETIEAYVFSGCTSLSTVIFSGEAPAIGENAFMGITATVNYPAGLDSWTEEVMQQYGGTITWTATGHPDGWALEEGLWYYYADGEAVTGWQFVGGAWYYFNASGAMQTGWVQDGGQWYYMNTSGTMVTGWVKLGSVWYYLKPNGAMACNETMTINGSKYTFNANGAWVS